MAKQVECDEDQDKTDAILGHQQSNETLMGVRYPGIMNSVSSWFLVRLDGIMTYPAMPTDWGYCKAALSASQYTGVT